MTGVSEIILVLIASFIGAFGALFFKKCSGMFSLNLIKQLRNKYLIVGGVLYILATAFFVWALKTGELTILYPLVSTTYIWVAIFSVKFLKERMNIWKILGILAIMVGVVFIGISG